MYQQTYTFVWGESDSMFTLEAAVNIHTRARQVFATEPRSVIITCQRRMARAYYLDRDLRRAREIGNQLFRARVRREYFRGCQEVEALMLRFKSEIEAVNWSTLTDRKLLNTLRTYHHLLTQVLAYYQASTAPEYLEPAEDQLRRLVTRPQDVAVLIQPARLTEVEEEQIALLQLTQHRPITDRDILDHVNRFPHLAYNTYDERRIARFVRLRLRAARSQPTGKNRAQVRAIRGRKRALGLQQRRLYRRYTNPQVEQQAGLIQTMGYWRFRLKKYWAGAEFWCRAMFRDIARRLNIDVATLMWVYSTQDVARALRERKPLSTSVVKIRKTSYTYVLENGRVSLLTGAPEQRFLAQHLTATAEQPTRLYGAIAYGGRATGPVKIIHVHDLQRLDRETKTFSPGDILVTTMTQVHVIPLMQRAAAILTEQGGITSHAAILSRELNKPCLVGVKNVTTALKQGDIVSVDAHQGVVTIVERAAGDRRATIQTASPRPRRTRVSAR